MQFSPFFSYFLPLRPKYLSQHPAFEHPQHISLLYNQLDALISQIYFGMKLCMFRAVPLSIIRSVFTVHSALVYVIQVWRQLSSRSICSCQNKFVKLVHLVGFIIKIFVTMHGHMYVKKTPSTYWIFTYILLHCFMNRHIPLSIQCFSNFFSHVPLPQYKTCTCTTRFCQH
jgi:hypothetical protein